jgi:Aldose 1-epimerase
MPKGVCAVAWGSVACGSDAKSVAPAPSPKFNDAYVELSAENFQSVINGKNTDLFTIKNKQGMFAKITNLGAKMEQVVVPDKDGIFGDVVLGYESIAAVQGGQASMGAFMGRYANRIGGGTFVLDGVTTPSRSTNQHRRTTRFTVAPWAVASASTMPSRFPMPA